MFNFNNPSAKIFIRNTSRIPKKFHGYKDTFGSKVPSTTTQKTLFDFFTRKSIIHGKHLGGNTGALSSQLMRAIAFENSPLAIMRIKRLCGSKFNTSLRLTINSRNCLQVKYIFGKMKAGINIRKLEIGIMQDPDLKKKILKRIFFILSKLKHLNVLNIYCDPQQISSNRDILFSHLQRLKSLKEFGTSLISPKLISNIISWNLLNKLNLKGTNEELNELYTKIERSRRERQKIRTMVINALGKSSKDSTKVMENYLSLGAKNINIDSNEKMKVPEFIEELTIANISQQLCILNNNSLKFLSLRLRGNKDEKIEADNLKNLNVLHLLINIPGIKNEKGSANIINIFRKQFSNINSLQELTLKVYSPDFYPGLFEELQSFLIKKCSNLTYLRFELNVFKGSNYKLVNIIESISKLSKLIKLAIKIPKYLEEKSKELEIESETIIDDNIFESLNKLIHLEDLSIEFIDTETQHVFLKALNNYFVNMSNKLNNLTLILSPSFFENKKQKNKGELISLKHQSLRKIFSNIRNKVDHLTLGNFLDFAVLNGYTSLNIIEFFQIKLELLKILTDAEKIRTLIICKIDELPNINSIQSNSFSIKKFIRELLLSRQLSITFN